MTQRSHRTLRSQHSANKQSDEQTCRLSLDLSKKDRHSNKMKSISKPTHSSFKAIEQRLSLINANNKKDVHFEINTPNSQRKLSPVKSKYIKRLEYKHIEEMIEKPEFRQIIIPDFGFNIVNDYMQNQNDGWKKLVNYIKLPYRYERVENYVAARSYIKKKIEILQKMRESLLEKRISKKAIKIEENEAKTPIYDSFKDELQDLNFI